jgi:sugar phosphate isomerase/epimerase
VNLRDPAERPAAEQLLVELARLRKDDALFNDIVGLRGNRVPITAVVSNLADPRDGGRKKAVARVRRTIRTAVQPLRNR